MGAGSKLAFFPRRYTDGQKVPEKMLNITREMQIKTMVSHHLTT